MGACGDDIMSSLFGIHHGCVIASDSVLFVTMSCHLTGLYFCHHGSQYQVFLFSLVSH